MFKKFFLPIIFTLTSFSQFSYASLSATNENPLSEELNQVDYLKKEIVDLAKSAQGKCDHLDNSLQVRNRLDELVNKLIKITPRITANESLPLLIGSWKQIWADEPTTPPPGFCIDANEIYQVVLPERIYWNIGKNILPNGLISTGFIRGKFTINEFDFTIEFDKQVSKLGFLENGTNLYDIALRAQAGEFDSTSRPGRPIGLKGYLENVYVDEDIRIVRGGGSDFGGVFLFILERKSSID